MSSFRAKVYCSCNGNREPVTHVWWDTNDLIRGYIDFKCPYCGEKNTVTLSQCCICDEEEYRRAVEMANIVKEREDKLKKENRGKSHVMAPRKWWQRKSRSDY